MCQPCPQNFVLLISIRVNQKYQPYLHNFVSLMISFRVDTRMCVVTACVVVIDGMSVIIFASTFSRKFLLSYPLSTLLWWYVQISWDLVDLSVSVLSVT